MRSIAKGHEPQGLTEYRAGGNREYVGLTKEKKDELRKHLVREQRGICCYCMDRISDDAAAMKIEHWRPQSQCEFSPGCACLQVDYQNLLGACLGGQGLPERLQHCDTRKGNAQLTFNPADPARRIENLIVYSRDGTISSTDPTFAAELRDVLGLNIAKLKKNREGVLRGLLEWWQRENARHAGKVPRALLERKHAKILGLAAEDLAPFAPVALWWLERKLSRKSGKNPAQTSFHHRSLGISVADERKADDPLDRRTAGKVRSPKSVRDVLWRSCAENRA